MSAGPTTPRAVDGGALDGGAASDFTPELRSVAERLDVPQPMRSRILLELGADLEDMRDRLVAQGLPAPEARRRAVAALVPADEPLGELTLHHRPPYLRLLGGLADPTRHRLERVGLLVGVLLLALPCVALLGDLALLVDPAPATPPLLGLGIALLGLVLWKTFQVHVRRDHRPRRLRRGLGWLPAIATAAVVIGLGGAAVDLYVVAGQVEAGAIDPTSLLLAWLRRDMAMASLGLVVGALAIAAWIWLSTAVARVEQAEADVLLTFRAPGGAP